MKDTAPLVRVLVVDDSAFMRRLISDQLESSGRIKVVGIARNGIDAIAKNLRFKPDVITLDIEMPQMDGLSALTELMRTRPVPVVMLSSLTQQGSRATLEALARGAIDFISKPESPQQIQTGELGQNMIETVLQAAAVELGKLTPPTTAFRGRGHASSWLGQSVKPPASPESSAQGRVDVVAIGTSTGGPRALQEVLSRLPADGRTAYLVVQHMPPGFTRTLAERLDALSELTVREAREEMIKPDHAYIAPGDYHLTVRMVGRNAYLQLSQSATVNGHRPAVDVLFHSLADLPGLCRVAVVLTGMGADGAQGLLALKAGGTFTIAEAAKTAVIFGMPKAAIAAGAVHKIVALDDVVDAIAHGLAGGRES